MGAMALPRKMKAASTRRLRKRYFAIAMIVITLGGLFYWFDQSLQPALRHVATIRLKQMTTQAINLAITQQVAQSDRFDNLMEWKTAPDGQVNGAVFNQRAHAQMTAECIKIVEQTLTNLHKVPEEVPLGMLLDSSLIAQFGPRIKLTLMPAGIVRAEMGSQWKEAGINTMMLEIFVTIQAEVRVLVGFDSASAQIETRIPLTYAVFNGEVPNYYMNQKPPASPILPGLTPGGSGWVE
jgi:sporulation protein YunB